MEAIYARKQQLLRVIEGAFQGVELHDGVSLHETVVLDEWGSAEKRQDARLFDEKSDWRKLVRDPELLRTTGVGGICFFDAAGMRFHLPAYLSLAVRDYQEGDNPQVLDDLIWKLTCTSVPKNEQFSLLNQIQRECVQDVLRYLHEAFGIGGDKAVRAIARWSTGSAG